MRASLNRLPPCDLIVVGGGITGAFVAHDATLRGLSVAVIDRADFGAATSAASSRILHGGIRFLQQGRFDKVRESARERARFRRITPHLTRDVPFLVPTYPGLLKGRLALRAALAVYGWCCRGLDTRVRQPVCRMPAPAWWSRDQVIAAVPSLSRSTITGAHILFESHMYSAERMTLAVVRTAARNGATAANYVEAVRLLRGRTGAVAGVVARDLLDGGVVELRARAVVNACGPGLSHLAGDTRSHATSARRWAFKGVHIITRELVPGIALALPSRHGARTLIDRGSRHIFVIPWRGHSIIGTSNSPFAGDPAQVEPGETDVAGLVEDVCRALPGCDLTIDDVVHATAGLFLVRPRAQGDRYQGATDYEVVDHARHGLPNLISVLGARFTTARAVAARAVDLVQQRLGHHPGRCTTGDSPLLGGDIADPGAFLATLRHDTPLVVPDDVLAHLAAAYGTEAPRVLAAGAPGVDPLRRLTPRRESIEGEVVYAVAEEMAVHLDDVVLRRTGLGTIGHPGQACLGRVADIMAGLLRWSPARQREEVARVERVLRPCRESRIA